MRILILSCFMIFIMAGYAYAQDTLHPKSNGYISASQLKTYCQTHYDVDQGYCAGFITAVADIMQEHRLYHFEACNMGYLRPQQIVDLVKKTLITVPQDKVMGNARLFVAYALAKEFPCL